MADKEKVGKKRVRIVHEISMAANVEPSKIPRKSCKSKDCLGGIALGVFLAGIIFIPFALHIMNSNSQPELVFPQANSDGIKNLHDWITKFENNSGAQEPADGSELIPFRMLEIDMEANTEDIFRKIDASQTSIKFELYMVAGMVLFLIIVMVAIGLLCLATLESMPEPDHFQVVVAT